MQVAALKDMPIPFVAHVNELMEQAQKEPEKMLQDAEKRLAMPKLLRRYPTFVDGLASRSIRHLCTRLLEPIFMPSGAILPLARLINPP
jgi:hypothetical protein